MKPELRAWLFGVTVGLFVAIGILLGAI